MSEPFGYGMVGCGEIATYTSERILDSDRCRLIQCMDPVETLAADIAARHAGATYTTRFEDILENGRVEGVIISTPHYLHMPQTIAAAQAGKHVLVEKPIACTLSEADAMIAACSHADVTLGVLYPARFGFPIETARRFVRGGAIGTVHAVQFHFMYEKAPCYWTGGYTGRAKTDWRMSRAKSGGGVTLINLSHDLDAMNHILDMQPIRIQSEYDTHRTPGVDVEDFMSFIMRLRTGTIVSLNASSAAAGSLIFGTQIYGEKGVIHITSPGLRVFTREPFEGLKPDAFTEIATPPDAADGRRLHVDGFARAARVGQPAPVSGEEARRTLEIIRGAYLAGKRHAAVEFPVQDEVSDDA